MATPPLLDLLQGWWENSCLKNGAHFVKGNRVFVNNTQILDVLHIASEEKLTLGKYSGVVERHGKEMQVSWNAGQIVWTRIGQLPDMYDPVTKQGRFKYKALLGKGAHGVVLEAIDMNNTSIAFRPRVAVKVLRGIHASDKGCGKRAARMHCEYLWSHMFLHNTTHEHYSPEKAHLFLKYLEDHTGLPPKSNEELCAVDLIKQLESCTEVAKVPYVVMELATGEMSWKALFPKSGKAIPFTLPEKREVIRQMASALEYLRKFDLLHRDLRFHNMFISREQGNVQVMIGDLGMMGHRTQSLHLSSHAKEGWKTRDWIPWEAWNIGETWNMDNSPLEVNVATGNAAIGRGEVQDVGKGWQAFDVFSLGVMHLYMCLGQAETRRILTHIDEKTKAPTIANESAKLLVLDAKVAIRMVSGKSDERPTPIEISKSLEGAGENRSIFAWLSASSRRMARSRSPRRAQTKATPVEKIVSTADTDGRCDGSCNSFSCQSCNSCQSPNA